MSGRVLLAVVLQMCWHSIRFAPGVLEQTPSAELRADCYCAGDTRTQNMIILMLAVMNHAFVRTDSIKDLKMEHWGSE